jgi:transposase InsO family protein
MAPHIRTELVLDALGMAVLRRAPESGETILHSDHGSQLIADAIPSSECSVRLTSNNSTPHQITAVDPIPRVSGDGGKFTLTRSR